VASISKRICLRRNIDLQDQKQVHPLLQNHELACCLASKMNIQGGKCMNFKMHVDFTKGVCSFSYRSRSHFQDCFISDVSAEREAAQYSHCSRQSLKQTPSWWPDKVVTIKTCPPRGLGFMWGSSAIPSRVIHPG